MAVKNKTSSLEKAKMSDLKERTKAAQKLLRIKLVRSVIRCPQYQREVVKGLGLRKVNEVQEFFEGNTVPTAQKGIEAGLEKLKIYERFRRVRESLSF